MNKFIAPSAIVETHLSNIGNNVKIWHFVHIRENVKIGNNVIIGKGVYIDEGVTIGDNVKIGNNVSIFKGVTIGNNVFIGPHTCFCNDKYPAAVNEKGELAGSDDWECLSTIISDNVSIGANCTILPGLTIGYRIIIGAGSVVTKSLVNLNLDHGMMVYFGNPIHSCGYNLF